MKTIYFNKFYKSFNILSGILIIVSAGIFILYREKIKEQEITTDQPLR